MAIAVTLPATGRCHACGASLRYLRDHPRYYCCLACMHRVPPRLAAAMAEYGADDPRDLLLRILRGTGTIDAAAGLLGVRKQALYGWIQTHGIRRTVVWE